VSHVLLIGFMGSGKSTVGRLLAEELSMPFVDLDECVVEDAGMSIPEIFAVGGEERFRELETTDVVVQTEGRSPREVADDVLEGLWP